MKLTTQLKKILSEGISGNQSQLVNLLNQKGLKTTQSTVSRILKKINAVKGVDENGNTRYSLPRAEQGIRDTGFFESLVLSILDNGSIIVIHTRPGTANTVAKVIDDHGFDEILGSVAGDDTIMVAPSDTGKIRQTADKIRSYLKRAGIF